MTSIERALGAHKPAHSGDGDASDRLSQWLTDNPSLLPFKNVHSRVLGGGFKGPWVPHLPRLLAFRLKTLFPPYHSWVCNWFCEQWVGGSDWFGSRYCHKEIATALKLHDILRLNEDTWYKLEAFIRNIFEPWNSSHLWVIIRKLFNLSVLSFLIHNIWIFITVIWIYTKNWLWRTLQSTWNRREVHCPRKVPFPLVFPITTDPL